MKSIKEVSLESKILKRLEGSSVCTELVNYLFADDELQEMQDMQTTYLSNVSDITTTDLFICAKFVLTQ